MATVSLLDSGDYHITCGEADTSQSVTRVVPGLEEYWSCAFQFDQLSVFDPESDPACSEGYEDYAYQGGQYFVQEGPGVFVLDED